MKKPHIFWSKSWTLPIVSSRVDQKIRFMIPCIPTRNCHSSCLYFRCKPLLFCLSVGDSRLRKQKIPMPPAPRACRCPSRFRKSQFSSGPLFPVQREGSSGTILEEHFDDKENKSLNYQCPFHNRTSPNAAMASRILDP